MKYRLNETEHRCTKHNFFLAHHRFWDSPWTYTFICNNCPARCYINKTNLWKAVK